MTSGSKITTLGVCVDMMSHIFVCDVRHCKIHILDKDGHFVSYLLTKSDEMICSFKLSYKLDTRCLWIGSKEFNENNSAK